jgi:Na+/H+-dicarboxylate symporter
MSDNEPNALKDYAKFALYFLPCLGAVAFTNTFLVPRFRTLLTLARPDGDLPPVLSTLNGAFEFFVSNFYLVVPPLVIVFVIAELRLSAWRRIRGRVLGILRFIFVLATILALVILATTSLAFLPSMVDDNPIKPTAEQDGADQPAAAVDSKP